MDQINTTNERRFFTKVILSVYFLWITAFVGLGFYASTLPPHTLTTVIDQNIPLVPEFIWIYMACYVLPLLSILLIMEWHRFNRMLLSFAMANLSAFIVYLVLPATFQKPELGRSIAEQFLSICYVVPLSGSNNFPSMHVTFPWPYYLMCRRQRLKKIGDAVMLFLIVLITVSTLFVKTHLVADAVAGILWAFITFALAKYIG
jgi:membrane-associated phospholipid phosphatase